MRSIHCLEITVLCLCEKKMNRSPRNLTVSVLLTFPYRNNIKFALYFFLSSQKMNQFFIWNDKFNENLSKRKLLRIYFCPWYGNLRSSSDSYARRESVHETQRLNYKFIKRCFFLRLCVRANKKFVSLFCFPSKKICRIKRRQGAGFCFMREKNLIKNDDKGEKGAVEWKFMSY